MAGIGTDYMRLHVIDIITSPSWYAQPMAMRGAYIQALIVSWMDDGLPLDLEELRGGFEPFLGDVPWERVKAFLEKQFPDGLDDKRRNLRQERERAWRNNQLEKFRDRSRKGNEARWGNGSRP